MHVKGNHVMSLLLSLYIYLATTAICLLGCCQKKKIKEKQNRQKIQAADNNAERNVTN